MAKLLDLVNELLLGIIDVIRVEDIEAFTLCNKHIHFLSKEILQKHRAMKRKYSIVQVLEFTSWSPYALDVRLSVHPMVWLNEIVLDETVALYPTHLHIQEGTRRVRNDHNWPSSDNGTETKDLIYSKLEQCSYIQRKELDSWKEDMYSYRSVGFDKAIALLLTLLPNLRSISTEGHRKFPECTEHMVFQIAKAHEVDKQQTHALSRFVSVYQTYGPANNPTISVYLPFTGLPSMRSVFGDTVDGRSELYTDLPSIRDIFGDAEGMSKTFKSGITKISFTQSRISSSVFEELLCRIGTLQDFKYEDDCGRSPGFQPGKIVNSLLTHTGHSLRYLDLTGKTRLAVGSNWKYRWREDPFDSDGSENDEAHLRRCFFMGSLSHFQVLKTIKVDNATFVEKIQKTGTDGKISSKVHRLVDLLPVSIEKLALVALLGYHSSNFMFDGLVESKVYPLPKLEEIKFDYSDPIVRDLKRGCRDIGVELVAPTTSHLGSGLLQAVRQWWTLSDTECKVVRPPIERF